MGSQKENLIKFLKQLEGLDITERIFVDILTEGIGALNGDSEAHFNNYAQIMSNHYLPRFEMMFKRMATELNRLGRDQTQNESILHGILDDIVFMQSSANKIRAILNDRLTHENGTIDAELRGLTDYKVNSLRTKKYYKDNVCIFPLSFHCVYDSNIGKWYQRYFWLDMEDGAIYHTMERLDKSLSNISPKEALFKKHRVLELYYEPGAYNGLIRWNNKEAVMLNPEDYHQLLSFAEPDIPTAVNKMKGYIKKTQAEKSYPVMLPVSRIGMVDKSMVLEDYEHHRIVLYHQDGIDNANRSICNLFDLPYEYKERQTMFGILFYDASELSVYFHPHTLFTEDKIYRLID